MFFHAGSVESRGQHGKHTAKTWENMANIWEHVENIYGQAKIFHGKNLANMTCLTCFLMLFDRFKSMIVGGPCVPLIDNFEQNIQASYHLHIHSVYTCIYIYRL